MLKMRIFNEQL